MLRLLDAAATFLQNRAENSGKTLFRRTGMQFVPRKPCASETRSGIGIDEILRSSMSRSRHRTTAWLSEG